MCGKEEFDEKAYSRVADTGPGMLKRTGATEGGNKVLAHFKKNYTSF
jgi:hypothetical protein